MVPKLPPIHNYLSSDTLAAAENHVVTEVVELFLKHLGSIGLVPVMP